MVIHTDGGEIDIEIHLQQSCKCVASNAPAATVRHGGRRLLQFLHIDYSVFHPIPLVNGQVPDAAGEGTEHQVGAGDVGKARNTGNLRSRDGNIFVARDHLTSSERTCVLRNGDASLVGKAGISGGLADDHSEVPEIPDILGRFGIVHLLPEFFLHQGQFLLVGKCRPIEFDQVLVFHQRLGRCPLARLPSCLRYNHRQHKQFVQKLTQPHLVLCLLVCICRRIRTFQCLEQDVHFIEHFFHLFRGGFQFFQRFFKGRFLAKGGGKHLFQHRSDVL